MHGGVAGRSKHVGRMVQGGVWGQGLGFRAEGFGVEDFRSFSGGFWDVWVWFAESLFMAQSF